MFIQRMNEKLIIGSQHGSEYGYLQNSIKTEFSEYLLDGFISAGFNSKHKNWLYPYLDFFPISPKFAKHKHMNKKINSYKSDRFSILYIESQFNLNKTMTSDRMNYCLTNAKYNSYKLIKNLLNNLKSNECNNLFIKPWIQKEDISPLKDSKLNDDSHTKLISSHLVNFIQYFNGLIVLDDISTPMCECMIFNKPILIVISRINEYSIFANQFFEQMISNKFIVSSVEDAKESIAYFQRDPITYIAKQKQLFKGFKSLFCNTNYYKPIEISIFINKIIKEKNKNL
tara:strand:- start:184 stop:1038 length:855 start_codon:yes stop_codon:yes gene_type:complete